MSNRPPDWEFSKHTISEALRRSDYCCQRCGIKKKDTPERYLEIHHILPIFFALEYFPHMPSFLMSSLQNAEVMCVECHKKHHAIEDHHAYSQHALYLKNLLNPSFSTGKRTRV